MQNFRSNLIVKWFGLLVYNICGVVLIWFVISANGQNSRIVGGEDAIPNEFPFLISLRPIGGGHICGGSILNAQWILTAAHCITRPANELEIAAGKQNLAINEPTEQIRRVEATFIHPDYENFQTGSDVALIRLSTDLTLNNAVQAVNLEPEGYVRANDAIITGWGDTVADGPTPNILQKAIVPIIPNLECRAFFPFLLDTMMCAGAENRGICQGDSGGPLICTSVCGMVSVQCGIVSWSRVPCDAPGVPEGFTRVIPFLGFLRDTIAANTRPSRSLEL